MFGWTPAVAAFILNFMARYPDTGGPIARRIPEGDDRPRLVCDTCGYIHYDNPKIVVGAVATWQDKILLCRRSIEPQAGFWTLPAGFLELHESPPEGAIREAHEEAHAEIAIDTLLSVYTIARISLIQLFYRAQMVTADVKPGIESLEVALFGYDEIPWDSLAFPSVSWALRHFDEVRNQPVFAPFTNPDGQTGFYKAGEAAKG